MKSALLLAAIVLSHVAISQVLDYTYTDCNSNTESVYEIIGQGTPLLIASTGLDCSICMGQAPAIKTFSEEHPEVRVWGAMNYKYSTNLPACTGVNQWENDYAWNDIFMFADVNDEWQGLGYPTYYVINPADSLIQYQGSSFTQASLLALSFVATGINTAGNGAYAPLYYYDATLHTVQFSNPGAGLTLFSLINSAGQKVFETRVGEQSTNPVTIVVPENLATGIYFAVLRDEKQKSYIGKVMVR